MQGVYLVDDGMPLLKTQFAQGLVHTFEIKHELSIEPEDK
jgi:hypothetical protein